jgi:Rrf2 family protein
VLFSKACEYAIRATVHIAERTAADEQATVRSVAAATGIPEAFTAKALQKLVRAGLVGSMKGPGGGFNLTPARARKLKLSAIVDAIDGDAVYTACGLGLPHCNEENPCVLHSHFMEVREKLRTMLESTSIHDLVSGTATAPGPLRRAR